MDSQLRSKLHAIRGEESPEAPTLAMKSAAMSKTDEPWAWECREALRELVIGKAVEFKVDYSLQDRQFGTLTYGGKNVAEHLKNEARHLQNEAPHLKNELRHLQNGARDLEDEARHLQNEARSLEN